MLHPQDRRAPFVDRVRLFVGAAGRASKQLRGARHNRRKQDEKSGKFDHAGHRQVEQPRYTRTHAGLCNRLSEETCALHGQPCLRVCG